MTGADATPMSPLPAGAIDAPLATRLAADLARLWPEARRIPDATLGIAVSGGPDSLALLLVAAAALRDGAWQGRLAAATVDHRLRPESAREAAMVADVCARLGIAHAILTVTVGEGNTQAQARAARYAALAEWMAAAGMGALATAHHADDQAETLLMRLNRASGVAGLAGVRERGIVPGTRLPVLRPVLFWRRADLAGVVAGAGLVPVDDPSNRDDAYDRARLRGQMAAAEWLDVAAIAQSAAHLADADAALAWAAACEWEEGVKREGLGMTYRPRAPRAIALRVLARLVAELDSEGGGDIRGGSIARLFDSLVSGQPASIGNLVARPGPAGWSFTKAPARRV